MRSGGRKVSMPIMESLPNSMSERVIRPTESLPGQWFQPSLTAVVLAQVLVLVHVLVLPSWTFWNLLEPLVLRDMIFFTIYMHVI